MEMVERTGSNADEITMAAQALVSDGVEVVLTPTDFTVLTAERSAAKIFREAGIPHYVGCAAAALHGAFLGYGPDGAALGRDAADMAAAILLDGADPASTPVHTCENRTAALNAGTWGTLGRDPETVRSVLEAFGTVSVVTDAAADLPNAESAAAETGNSTSADSVSP